MGSPHRLERMKKTHEDENWAPSKLQGSKLRLARVSPSRNGGWEDLRPTDQQILNSTIEQTPACLVASLSYHNEPDVSGQNRVRRDLDISHRRSGRAHLQSVFQELARPETHRKA